MAKELSQDWLNWILENIQRGCDKKELLDILLEEGFDPSHCKVALGFDLTGDDFVEAKTARRREQDAGLDDPESTPTTSTVVENVRHQQRRGRSRSRGRDDEESPASLEAFLVERTAIDKRVKGNRRKQMQGKTLRYEYCDDKTRAGLDKSRAKEWKNGWTLSQGKVTREGIRRVDLRRSQAHTIAVGRNPKG